jgi:hypothetical protein
VRASRAFATKFRSLQQDSGEYLTVDTALSTLKQNIFAGVEVPKNVWPETYVKNHGIRNLYKLDIRGGRRLTYTIVAEKGGRSVIVLDYFGSHKEYEVFFGY